MAHYDESVAPFEPNTRPVITTPKYATSTYVAPPLFNMAEADDAKPLLDLDNFRQEHSTEHKSIRVKGYNGGIYYVATTGVLTVAEYKRLLHKPVYADKDTKLVVTDPSQIGATFVELTQFTTSYGSEVALYDDALTKLGFVRNGRDNYWLTVGDGTSKTLFVAHMDTADHYHTPVKVNHVFESGVLRTDGTTILGADDKAGVAVLLYLISQGVPGDYLLVVGEEAGCIGSGAEADHIPEGKYSRAIQFDRAGTSEIITHQMGGRTASDDFAYSLAKQFRVATDGKIRLKPSDRGVYTDTREFVGVIPECTNIAIGYKNQHSALEEQDMVYLIRIGMAAAQVKWEELPTVRKTFKAQLRQNYKNAGGRTVYYADDVDDEIVHLALWEVWMKLDEGQMTKTELRKWIISNPTKSAELMYKVLTGPDGLDILTSMEDV